jgi:hypothetical protein
MALWIKFLVGSLVLTLVVVGGLLLLRRRQPPAPGNQPPAQDAGILYLLLGLAWMSILGYIAFAFWKH